METPKELKLLHTTARRTWRDSMMQFMKYFVGLLVVRAMLLCAFCSLTLPSGAQIALTMKPYEAVSYSDMVAPLMLYASAYKNAEKSFVEYQQKFEAQRRSSGHIFTNPRLALTYIQKCISLNERFKDNLADPGPLYYDMSLVYRHNWGTRRKNTWHCL